MTTATAQLDGALITLARTTPLLRPHIRPGSHRAESYDWSRLTSLENVLSSPLLFCS
jgi:hypothetical protein